MIKGFCDRCGVEIPMSRAAIKDGVDFYLADSEYESSVTSYYGEPCIQVRYNHLYLCKGCAEELYEMNKKFMEKKEKP